MIRVEVPLGERSYPVVIGAGSRNELASLLPDAAERVAVVTQERVGVEVETGRKQWTFTVPDGERAKSMAEVAELCGAFARFGLTRADAVVAVGGGVVTDLAGFAASVYMRGVAVAHVATTLLAQVDAAIGGKTGVDLPEGKNLVGTFWQPVAVVCDTGTLATLPPRQLRSGRGEMAKYAFLGVPDLTGLPLDEQVAACVACKVEVVTADEREAGRRAILNYGHTLAHALEAAAGYEGILHGEAVAVGLAFAARLARRVGRIDDAGVAEHDRVVRSFELSTELPPGSRVGELMTLMARDKKAVSGLTFVLDGPAGIEVVPAVETAAVEETLVEMGAR
jgi:5-deoxy-5-amino-3-dehydroquinate synthase